MSWKWSDEGNDELLSMQPDVLSPDVMEQRRGEEERGGWGGGGGGGLYVLLL